MKIAFGLGTIAQVDEGRPAAAFNLALKDAIEDIKNRGFDKKPRVVSLIVTVTPKLKDGVISRTEVTIDTKKNFPLTRSDAYEMQLHASGALLFSDGEAEKAQMRLDDVREDKNPSLPHHGETINRKTGEVTPPDAA